MIVRIGSAKDGAVNFDTITHTIIKIPFYALKEIDKKEVKPTLCFFCKQHRLIIALLEVSINHKVKYEISFIDRKDLDDLQDYFSAAIDDNNKATIENIDIESLDELISLRWLKMPLNKIGARKYYNKTSITKDGLESLDKELFIEQLKGEVQNTLDNDKNTTNTECNDVNEEVVQNSEDFNEVYMQVLKLMHPYDCITIPISIYKEIKVVDRRTISMNTSTTIRKTMTTLKFGDIDNIFAIADYNEETSLVKITVLKSFDNIQVTDREVDEVWVRYKNWNKANSFSLSRR